MEHLTSGLISALIALLGLVGGWIGGWVYFKPKMKKLDNENIKSDLEINKELLMALKEMQTEVSAMIEKLIGQEKVIGELKTENEKLKTEAVEMLKLLKEYEEKCDCSE